MSAASSSKQMSKRNSRGAEVDPKIKHLQGRYLDDRACRMCFYQLELLSKKQRRTRNDWSPLRVFGGRQLAHIAYETASRLINRVLPFDVVVEYIMNINECLAMIAKRQGAIDVVSDLRDEVEHFVDAVMDVADRIDSKSDREIVWNDLRKRMFKPIENTSSAKGSAARVEPRVSLADFDDVMPMGNMTTMSNVYSATCGKPGQKLIIRMRAKTNSYLLEKAIAVVLKPKFCVEYLAFFCTEKSHVFVQRGPYGIPLTELFSMQTLVNETFIAFIAYRLVIVLQKLHALGVIHRDIRPNSVVWHEECVKLVNAEHATTCIGNFLKPKSQAKSFYERTSAEYFQPKKCSSSRFYRAPEIIGKRPFGRASDFWCVGVTLFRLLCGRMPFRGHCKYALDYAIINEQPLWRLKSVKKISPELRDFVMSLLEKKSHLRLGSKMYSDLTNHRFFAEHPEIRRERFIRIPGKASDDLKCDDSTKPAFHEQIELQAAQHLNVESYLSRSWQEIREGCDGKLGRDGISKDDVRKESTSGNASPRSDPSDSSETKTETSSKISRFHRPLKIEF